MVCVRAYTLACVVCVKLIFLCFYNIPFVFGTEASCVAFLSESLPECALVCVCLCVCACVCACVCLCVCVSSLLRVSDSTARLLQENQSRLARFSSLLQEAEDHQAHSIVVSGPPRPTALWSVDM